MSASYVTVAADYAEAKQNAIRAFDALYGKDLWGFNGHTAEPASHGIGSTVPSLWSFEFSAWPSSKPIPKGERVA